MSYKKLLKSKDEGFTIIEVLIVLAIAGLILLIVFLAIPALQRNARNTQRKNDAAQVAAAVANFLSNNGGALPNSVAMGGDGGTPNGIDIYLSTNPNGRATYETAKLGTYSCGAAAGTPATPCSAATGGVIANGAPAANSAPIPAAAGCNAAVAGAAITICAGNFVILTGVSCDSNQNGVGPTNARDAAILYVTESVGSNGNLACLGQ